MLAIYGLDTPGRDWTLADVMTLFCRANMRKKITELSPQQLKSFCLCVIKDIRDTEQGKNMLPKTQYYEICNLTAHKWKEYQLYELRGMVQSMLQIWVDDAARQLELELDAINMLDR